jgi:hypothetical protein
MVVVAFDLVHLAHLRPVAAIVAAHGATDLGSWRWTPRYALCCVAPLPPDAVTALFVVSSIAHFSEDVGTDGSVALHSLAGMATLMGGPQLGLEFMMVYLTLVHTPMHYLRCWQQRRWSALAFAALTTCVALYVSQYVDVVLIGHALQRVVVAHVWTEWSIGNKS